MIIKILFFGIARDISEKNSIEIEVKESLNIEDLKILLKNKYPKFDMINDFSLAVNETYTDDDYLLCNKDIVAIIPPVSGG